MQHRGYAADGEMPLVTIGIPCYQCAAHLPMLLRSIVTQSYPHWEVVAVDDGSTDGTREILKSIQDARFRVFLSDENLGLASRLNQIASLAQGSLLARTDADDILMPERLERQVRLFVDDPSLEVVSSGCYVVDSRNRLRGVRRVPPLARSAREVMLRNGPSHPTVMTTSGWARRNQYLCHSRRGEDLDLWIRTVGHSKMRALAEPLHIIREDGQFDAGKYLRTIREHRVVMRRYVDWKRDPLLALRLEARLRLRAWGYGWAQRVGLAGWMAARRQDPVEPSVAAEVEALLVSLQEECGPVLAAAS